MQTTTTNGKTFTLTSETEADQQLIDALANNRAAYVVRTERIRHPAGSSTYSAVQVLCNGLSEQHLREQAGRQALRALGQIIGLGLREATGGGHVAGFAIDPKAQEQFAPTLEQLQIMADALGSVVRQIKLQSGVRTHDEPLVVEKTIVAQGGAA